VHPLEPLAVGIEQRAAAELVLEQPVVASGDASVRCDSGAKPKRLGPPCCFAAG
jgi:hypothetical protein